MGARAGPAWGDEDNVRPPGPAPQGPLGDSPLESTSMVRRKSGKRSALCASTERCSEGKSYESNMPPLNY